MNLIYHTPFYRNSDFMAHLIEHAILHPRSHTMNGEEFFMIQNVEGSLRGEYITINYDESLDPNTIIHFLQQPVSSSIIEYEMDIFAEEFGDLSYSVRAFEKYYQLLHGKSRSGRQQTYTQEEINSYHRSYIQQASYVIAHPDTGVMQYHGDVKAGDHISGLPALGYQHLLLEGESNHYIQFPGSVEGILLARFFEGLIDSYDSFQKRYMLGSYYSHSTGLHYCHDLSILRFGPHTKLPLDQDAYHQYQQSLPYALDAHYRWYAKSLILLNHQVMVDDQELLEYLQLIPFDYVHDILKQARTM